MMSKSLPVKGRRRLFSWIQTLQTTNNLPPHNRWLSSAAELLLCVCHHKPAGAAHSLSKVDLSARSKRGFVVDLGHGEEPRNGTLVKHRIHALLRGPLDCFWR